MTAPSVYNILMRAHSGVLFINHVGGPGGYGGEWSPLYYSRGREIEVGHLTKVDEWKIT